MKPMLAATATLEDISTALRHGPLWASPKIDGVRAVKMNGALRFRSLDPIPNPFVQAMFAMVPEGWDGELVCGEPTAPDVFTKTTGNVRRHTGEPTDTRFLVFDNCKDDRPFHRRHITVAKVIQSLAQVGAALAAVPHAEIATVEEFSKIEEHFLKQGYEGVILRDPNAPYKFGRSTVKQRGMLKVKRFEDSEAVVIGFEELMHNDNPATTNALGRTERSSHKEHQVPADTLGALVVRDVKSGVEFKIGSGFTAEQRQDIWLDRRIGELVTYKHMPHGAKDAPRHPIFKGFRDKRDT